MSKKNNLSYCQPRCVHAVDTTFALYAMRTVVGFGSTAKSVRGSGALTRTEINMDEWENIGGLCRKCGAEGTVVCRSHDDDEGHTNWEYHCSACETTFLYVAGWDLAEQALIDS